MRTAAVTIPGMVREIITGNRSIYNCIKMDLINYTALAAKIQPQIENMIGSAVNLNTIVVAIKRYADSLEIEDARDEVLKNARLALTGGMMAVRVSAHSQMDPATILDRFSKITDNYDFFRLSDSFRFLAEDMESTREIFEDAGGVFSTGLAKIRVSIPGSQNKSDVVSFVAEVLHENGIELENAFFSQDSITIILDGNSASRAYDILHSIVSR
ncbi:MAG: ACT domain-containing protein [Thaumarchaeota archaeon]|nr:ACT domain-containing protein [Nitrososphaerota archaeon]